MTKANSWNVVVDRVMSKLSSWKARLLANGGRFTLIKVVLASVPLYYLTIFRAPSKVIDKLESIRRRFFWGFKNGVKGVSWVKWESALSNKEVGGLGIGSLKAKKLSLVGKWWWRFRKEYGRSQTAGFAKISGLVFRSMGGHL